MLDVLDRLQEDDRVAALVEALNQGALEAQVRPPVACLRVLVGLRVGIDPDDLGGAPGEHVGAVALATGEVGDRGSANALRDPLVDDQVAAIPVVLLGDVGQGALARERQRRDAGGLVSLQVDAFHGA